MPENGTRNFSTTFVDDLVSFIQVALAEQALIGTYNVITTPETRIMDIVQLCSEELGVNRTLVNAPSSFLSTQGVSEWSDIPLWLNCDHFTYSNVQMQKVWHAVPNSLLEGIQSSILAARTRNWPEPSVGLNNRKRQYLINLLLSMSNDMKV
jgi:nucleoside-diphosphate-sugar epimerase